MRLLYFCGDSPQFEDFKNARSSNDCPDRGDLIYSGRFCLLKKDWERRLESERRIF